MSRLAVVGLTARDTVDGGTPTTGGAPYYAAQALREVRARARLVTKLAACDVALLEPIESLGELVWRPASDTAAYVLSHDAETAERTVLLESLGEPWTAHEVESWVLPELAGIAVVHAGALCRADFPAETLALLARGRRLSLDGQGLVRPARLGPLTMERPQSLDVLDHVEVLKLSLEEAAVLGVEPTAASLAALGIPEVVLTAGPRGAWIYARGALVEVTADTVPVRDTTGAGDGFIACYLHARLDGASGADAGTLAARAVAQMLRRRLPTAP